MTSLKYLQLKESLIAQLKYQGMKLDFHKMKGAWENLNSESILAVYPDEDQLPHYARDAELFIGTLDDIQSWILGVQWLTGYYALLKIDNGSRRKQVEEKEREQQLLESLRTGAMPRNLKK